MNPIITLITYTLILLYSPALIFAQSPTTGVRDAIKKQVDAEIEQIKKAISKKAYLGTITTKTDGTFTLSTFPKNETKNFTIAPDAIIKLANGKDGTLADLKTDLFVLAMGDSDGNGLLTTKRILAIAKPTASSKQSVFGTVTKFTSSTLTITTKNNETWTIKINSSTKFTPEGVKFKDIDPGAKIVAVGSVSDKTLTATRIHQVVSATLKP